VLPPANRAGLAFISHRPSSVTGHATSDRQKQPRHGTAEILGETLTFTLLLSVLALFEIDGEERYRIGFIFHVSAGVSVSAVDVDFFHHLGDPLRSVRGCPAVCEVCEEVEGDDGVEPVGAGWTISAEA